METLELLAHPVRLRIVHAPRVRENGVPRVREKSPVTRRHRNGRPGDRDLAESAFGRWAYYPVHDGAA
ncbi:hypothetical protein AB0395_23230 [Streptosporangium sp. NPDC051023]|uniref:hypothetical protein n=1 Tax=Streptosporangium sp. NPDC051023 TaxID=3155410 RepID=UPI00344E8FBB